MQATTSTPTPTAYELASTPDIADLQTVEPLPFDLNTDWFDNTDTLLTSDAAHAILSEVWRRTRNPRLLEIEQEVRGQMVPDLQLSFIAARHLNDSDGVLDPTAVADTFIATARSEYPQQLADGPEPQWAALAAPAELDTLTIE